MKMILIFLLPIVSTSFAGEDQNFNETVDSCIEQITVTPFCVGLTHAEKFCSSFGQSQKIVKMAKQQFKNFIENGERQLDASALVFMGASSDQSEVCQNQ